MNRFALLFSCGIIYSLLSCTQASLENTRVRLDFNLQEGTYTLTDKSNKDVWLENSCYGFNQYLSTDHGFVHRKTTCKRQHEGFTSMAVESENASWKMYIQFNLHQADSYLTIEQGITNKSGQPVQIRKIQPVVQGQVYPQQDVFRIFKVLDGFGGGEPTIVKEQLPVKSRNNIVCHASDGDTYHSFVVGGYSYTDYEKFATLSTECDREEQLRKEFPRLLAYIDLGFNQQSGYEEILRLGTGEPFRFYDSLHEETCTNVYGWNFLAIEALQLKPGKKYGMGITWVDNDTARVQCVYVDNGKDVLPSVLTDFKPLNRLIPENDSLELVVDPQRLPSLKKGETPETVYFSLPDSLTKNGSVRILVKHLSGANAVAAEAFLYEMQSDEQVRSGQPFIKACTDPRKRVLNLYAFDPVGRKLDAGQTYWPEDAFYLDFSTPCPFSSAENYALRMAGYNRVKLNYYDFPTVCMWYVQEKLYGNAGVRGSSVDAVHEASHIAQSGFLRYSRAAVRLVPVSIGWYDDAHDLYGTYESPYETIEKFREGVLSNGVIPFTYFTNTRFLDDNSYADAFPGHMLFNKSKAYVPCFDFMQNALAGFDYTDPGYRSYLVKDVFPRYKKAGVGGAMWDWPYICWNAFGGMEDATATAGYAYRQVYQLAKEGWGDLSLLQERNLDRGADITLGLVSSQRTWGDTDLLTPEMVSRTGLRWYKNRVLFNYDADSKNLLKALPANRDGIRKLLTMSYVAGSRFLMANSFSQLSHEMISDLSRIFPFHTLPKSARPLDLFEKKYPEIYDFAVSPEWHQLTFYNTDDAQDKVLAVHLSKPAMAGGMALNDDKEYYAFDFWNNHFIGKLKGTQTLEQNLRPGEARMISIREVKDFPQVVSTNRHIMQGLVDLRDVSFNGSVLCGEAFVSPGETFRIILALNSWEMDQCRVRSDKADVSLVERADKLVELCLRSDQPEKEFIRWNLSLKK